MEGFEIQPHIMLGKKDVTPVVLTVGDPARAELIAKKCDSYREIVFNREYRSFACVKDGQKFIVISHGVGPAGAAICFEELIYCGAQIIIRAGTAGILGENLEVGDVVLCEAAVRDDGASAQYIPKEFPAVTDIGVYQRLKQTADELKVKVKSGYTLTSDSFYQSRFVKEKLLLYAESNVSIVEMEVATLFVLGKLRGIRTGALCSVDGCPLGSHAENYDPTGARVSAGKTAMLEIAIRTCVSFAKEFA